MTYEFHPEARFEFRESVIFYEGTRPGLGSAFTVEIEAVLARILEAPERWPIFEGEIRRCLVRRFPYVILYIVESGHVLIIAVMHCSRKPDYWISRTRN